MMQRHKVLLVRAPNVFKSGGWKKQGVLRTPTNLAMLGSFIRESGRYGPEILDFELEDIREPDQIAESILSRGAEYIGFTTLTPRFPTVLRICDELKKQDETVTTIVGGPHITGRPQDCGHDSIDYGIAGEGEPAFLELLDHLVAGRDPVDLENLITTRDGQLVVNGRRPFVTDLDELPRPAWDLLSLGEYLDPGHFEGPHVGVFTTRGCPRDCVFCASGVTWKRKIRYRGVDSIMGEFTDLSETWGIKNLTFYDDHFAINQRRALELCNRIRDAGLGLKYDVQVRADSVTPALAVALKESGCVYAAVGVETGNEAMLKQIRKGETKNQIRQGVRLLRDAGIPTLTSYILGLPGDTHETIRQTLDFARELDTEQMKFMLLTPVPGTDVYRLAVERGLLDPNDLGQMERTTFYDSTGVNLSGVSNAELLRYQDEAYALQDAKQDGH
ncbi:MAG: radical SAM protein [archaeon]